MIIDAHVALDMDRYPVERALNALSAAKVGSASLVICVSDFGRSQLMRIATQSSDLRTRSWRS